VSPALESRTRTYHLFVEPDDLDQLWDNIEAGREIDCEPNPTWNDRVPATFVYEGEVFDTQVRYQGSRFNRRNGPNVDGFEGLGPERPDPFKAFSIRVAFPRYSRFDDRDTFVLNKLQQGCPGFAANLGFQLFELAGVPAPKTRYARVQLNGSYYHYAQEIERPGDTMLERFHEAEAGDGDHEGVGFLFKSTGALVGDVGPYGRGAGELLEPHCGYSPLERYGFTYDLNTNDW
jgi:hypothetical protein